MEVLDDTLFDEDDEEANICLIVDTTSKGYELDQEDKVNFDDPESLWKSFYELLSNSFILSQLTKTYKVISRIYPKII